ncbi:hypothetical protein OIDMADRAFT_50836 [Oidiodendron maius Zn]|uniref:Uncharacterized protein n=1 Tax=Oidiodendron maius (strain Zn) TaxID=913774 RepID=A0A0C3HPR6_OIDMZ|nr:hypothetical protein OIDMADRAFT_50836 [Oidiodendron maius Zn]
MYAHHHDRNSNPEAAEQDLWELCMSQDEQGDSWGKPKTVCAQLSLAARKFFEHILTAIPTAITRATIAKPPTRHSLSSSWERGVGRRGDDDEDTSKAVFRLDSRQEGVLSYSRRPVTLALPLTRARDVWCISQLCYSRRSL